MATESLLRDVYVGNVDVLCTNRIRLGNLYDGGWDVCDDIEHRPQSPCLVYSFGINHDFSFDDAVSDKYGCEVHSFDPSYVVNVDVKCTNRIRLGKPDDGGWDVCDDIEHRPQSPCLVYSFGINNDFSFDDAVSAKYGCEVHSFDPSMGQNDHKHSDRVFFHKLGISDKDFVNDKAWTMRTLTSIKKQLNHTKINILKMDIEEDEYKALPNIIASDELKDVDQLLFEIHYNSHNDQATIIDFMVRGLELLRDLRNLGFYVFHSHPNEHNYITSKISGSRRTTCHELYMLNVNRNRK
ncbi:hypothetical protein C0Q70_16742 [Pomacea canaliculata]|uniref:Methyltransferase domain-containing protein n=1 Tax=Pomacea canaliculata TaxID=400727 RepID=A0A2T7NQM0_POMCA|nr:hypothetical protein C0Q70_16742 [Pomacea canaliculata]